MIYLAVGVFGAFGALLRFGVGRLVGESGAPFAYGTLIVNVVGSFLIGYAFLAFSESGQFSGWPVWVRTGVTVGFFGALTTFSTFSLETVRMFTAGAVGLALLNVLANNLICLSCCYAGWKIGQL